MWPVKTSVRRSLILFPLLVVPAGCAGGDDERATTPSSRAPTSLATKAPPSTAAHRPGARDGPEHFDLPSHNIGCFVEAGSARCDIVEKEWDPPPKPPDCDLDWGHAIAVDGGQPAGFVCAGDTALGGPAILAYGDATRRDGVVCESEERGVTCTDNQSGHGFFISRGSYRLF